MRAEAETFSPMKPDWNGLQRFIPLETRGARDRRAKGKAPPNFGL